MDRPGQMRFRVDVYQYDEDVEMYVWSLAGVYDQWSDAMNYVEDWEKRAPEVRTRIVNERVLYVSHTSD